MHISMLKNGKKYLGFLLWSFLSSSSLISAEMTLESFQNKYDLIYQDIVFGDKIYSIGSDLCEPRYKIFKKVLDSCKRPFTVLDLGAAQGYFSFRIAQDYLQSSCVMIEANNTAYYAHHGSMLYDLCLK